VNIGGVLFSHIRGPAELVPQISDSEFERFHSTFIPYKMECLKSQFQNFGRPKIRAARKFNVFNGLSRILQRIMFECPDFSQCFQRLNPIYERRGVPPIQKYICFVFILYSNTLYLGLARYALSYFGLSRCFYWQNGRSWPFGFLQKSR
jgi:hypothetical protein